MLHSGFYFAAHDSDFTTIHFGLSLHSLIMQCSDNADAQLGAVKSAHLALLTNLGIPVYEYIVNAVN
jgi:hypothetical protein